MLNQLKHEECVGHVVRHVDKNYDCILLVFDHGYLAYGALDLESMDIDDVWRNFGERAIAAGVISRAEYDEMRMKEKQQEQARRDYWDRANYERLKAKFEGK